LSKASISQTFTQALQTQNLQIAIAKTQNKTHIKGLVGSALSFVLSETFKQSEKPFLLIFNDKEEAAFYLNDFEVLLNTKDVLFYP
jgi:transcription-repair coupling factor (superfamily II helicase)